MRAQSVRALIERGDIRRDHLFEAATQVSISEVEASREVLHGPKEIRTQAQAFEYPGNRRPTGVSLKPVGIGGGRLSCCFRLLDPADSSHLQPPRKIAGDNAQL